jgi:hypothetical protein
VALLTVAGGCFLVFAVGDTLRIFGLDVPMPYRVLRRVVPGMEGVRVTARFFVVTQLAIAMLAAVGIAAVIRRLSTRGRVGVMAALLALVVVESLVTIQTVEVPSLARYGAVNKALENRPAGTVLELPILDARDGAAWAYVEAPRQSLAALDEHPRVNGYSGFEPPTFGQSVDALERFPAAAAVAEADRLGVRYVVLRTELVGALPRSLVAGLGLADSGRYSDAEARAIIDRIPPDRVRDVAKVRGAYLVELTRPRQGAG